MDAQISLKLSDVQCRILQKISVERNVDISGPGGGTISSNIHFTDAWYLNGNAHAAGTNLGLQSETASIRYVIGSWYVSLP